MLGQFIFLLPILYVVLQWLAIARMRDGWLTAARLPILFMAFALALMAVGIALRVDLALLALLLGLPAATLYLLILWPLHLIVRGAR